MLPSVLHSKAIFSCVFSLVNLLKNPLLRSIPYCLPLLYFFFLIFMLSHTLIYLLVYLCILYQKPQPEPPYLHKSMWMTQRGALRIKTHLSHRKFQGFQELCAKNWEQRPKIFTYYTTFSHWNVSFMSEGISFLYFNIFLFCLYINLLFFT